MHGCAVVVATTWEASVASLAFALLFASIVYCAGKLWQHDRELVGLRKEIAAMQKDCVRHQEWMTKIQDTAARIDRNVARIGGKLDVDLEGPP